ncbi:hypothetical protein [Flavobacterium endophyticum]|uniref:hypothetical protein n=1 Tax=Flavobacterium endophyticum TaxID=1540163 RepID=UPI001FE69671|nr:hypothetical protein [Flavobacterium endophyticum]
MTSEELKTKTKKFSLRIIDVVEKLPNSISGRTVANQIVRSGTSEELIIEPYAGQEAIGSLFLKWL